MRWGAGTMSLIEGEDSLRLRLNRSGGSHLLGETGSVVSPELESDDRHVVGYRLDGQVQPFRDHRVRQAPADQVGND